MFHVAGEAYGVCSAVVPSAAHGAVIACARRADG